MKKTYSVLAFIVNAGPPGNTSEPFAGCTGPFRTVQPFAGADESNDANQKPLGALTAPGKDNVIAGVDANVTSIFDVSPT